MRILPFFLFVLVLASCRPSRPEGILSESQMARILKDYHLAQGISSLEQGKNDKEVEYANIQAVFRKYKVTEAQFDTSMIYYSIHAEKMSRIYAKVVSQLENQALSVGATSSEEQSIYVGLTAEGDTANIWNGPTLVTLSYEKGENLYRFRMTADSTFRIGDSFVWHFRYASLNPRSGSDAYVLMYICYENDSVSGNYTTIGRDGELELRCQPNKKTDSLNIKYLGGSVYLPFSTKEQTLQSLFLKDMALIRFHKKVVENVPVDSLATNPADSLQQDSVVLDSSVLDADKPRRFERPVSRKKSGRASSERGEKNLKI